MEQDEDSTEQYDEDTTGTTQDYTQFKTIVP